MVINKNYTKIIVYTIMWRKACYCMGISYDLLGELTTLP